MLEPKLKKAAQAILRNNSLLIASGSGMAADCKLVDRNGDLINKSYEKDYIPTFRGTYGLWKEYPVLRKNLISFDELVEESFFKDYPEQFWYVYGDLFNRYSRAVPHKGYNKLKEIIEMANKRKKHYVYHSGIDKLYLKSGFNKERYVQAKGSIMDWQCK